MRNRAGKRIGAGIGSNSFARQRTVGIRDRSEFLDYNDMRVPTDSAVDHIAFDDYIALRHERAAVLSNVFFYRGLGWRYILDRCE